MILNKNIIYLWESQWIARTYSVISDSMISFLEKKKQKLKTMIFSYDLSTTELSNTNKITLREFDNTSSR